MPPIWKPTPQQVRDAYGKSVPDLVKPNLRVLFCGINPGLYTAAVGNHFGRPGNRFWPALYEGGFTPRLYSPFEKEKLLDLGLGITNIVDFATARADELTKEQLQTGGQTLVKKIKKLKPHFAAIVGLGAYRVAFGDPNAKVGEQEKRIGKTRLWVLPNPSGLNAHYNIKKLGIVFGELREELEKEHR